MAQLNALARSGEDALADLHEGLTLMTYIQHAQAGPASANEYSEPVPGPERTQWQQIIDELCVICHFDPAGDTIIALGVEQKPHRSRFWMATNGMRPSNSTSKINAAKVFLSKVLRLIDEASWSNLQRQIEIVNEIADSSVRQSSKKVRNYLGGLASALADAESEHAAEPVLREDEWHVLRSVLQSIQSSHVAERERRYVEVCQQAYNFPTSIAFATLSKLVGTGNKNYARVNHYVGRLRIWKKAAAFIVRNAPAYRHVFHKTDVRIVPAAISNSAIHVETDLGVLVTRQCPKAAQNEGLLGTTVARLQTAGNQINKLASNAQLPTEHAEAIIAHHFHINGLPFANNERYVGCSKPSCYACALYFRLHPGQFVPRRTHGHAWLRWLPPMPERRSLASDRETQAVVESMIQVLRRDIEDRIFRARYGKQRNFSSTTGMTLALM